MRLSGCFHLKGAFELMGIMLFLFASSEAA